MPPTQKTTFGPSFEDPQSSKKCHNNNNNNISSSKIARIAVKKLPMPLQN
jgi:hypothetical protein